MMCREKITHQCNCHSCGNYPKTFERLWPHSDILSFKFGHINGPASFVRAKRVVNLVECTFDFVTSCSLTSVLMLFRAWSNFEGSDSVSLVKLDL